MVDVQDQYLKQITAFYWENGFSPDPMQLERLAFFAELVTEKNEAVNLISRRDVDSIVENHVFISAYIIRFLPEKISTFLDIGTGGGFPGIPMAIMRPSLRGVLVDSTTKKIDAVKDFIDKLKMSNVAAENMRVESNDFIEKYRNNFDLVISRATVPLIILLRYSLPLLKEKGYIAAIKGGDIEEELQKAMIKYKPYIKKSTIFEVYYKPTNVRNQKGKKFVLLEINK
jgi:16S rRNA (guanine527-N7)-methyltransferase